MSQQAGADEHIGFRVSRVLVLFIYGFAIVCTVILAMAFFLELFNANEGTPFVQWVFRATDRIMQPFRGIFPAVEGESGSLLDPALLFAMFMYWLLALGMHALVGWIDREDRGRQVPRAVGSSSRVDDPADVATRGRRSRDEPSRDRVIVSYGVPSSSGPKSCSMRSGDTTWLMLWPAITRRHT